MYANKTFIAALIATASCYSILGRAAETNGVSPACPKPALVVLLSADATLHDVTNEIYVITARYQHLLVSELRGNRSLKRGYGKGECYEGQMVPGVDSRFTTFGENVASLTMQDERKTGHTIGYFPGDGHRRLSMYSQTKEGKADGPYVEFYRSGAVRCLFWFRDGLLTQGKIWDVNGGLKESKVFHPPVDIMKEASRYSVKKNK